jgi:hypothetical protein
MDSTARAAELFIRVPARGRHIRRRARLPAREGPSHRHGRRAPVATYLALPVVWASATEAVATRCRHKLPTRDCTFFLTPLSDTPSQQWLYDTHGGWNPILGRKPSPNMASTMRTAKYSTNRFALPTQAPASTQLGRPRRQPSRSPRTPP